MTPLPSSCASLRFEALRQSLPSLPPSPPLPITYSYVRYSYFGIALNELQGLVLTCTPQQLA